MSPALSATGMNSDGCIVVKVGVVQARQALDALECEVVDRNSRLERKRQLASLDGSAQDRLQLQSPARSHLRRRRECIEVPRGRGFSAAA